MASETAALGDAIAAELAAGSWPEPLLATREYAHEFETAEEGTLRCTVSTASLAGGLLTRGKRRGDSRVVLIFSKRLPDRTNAEVDPCVETVELIRKSYGGSGPRLIAGTTGARAMEATADPLYDPDLLRDQLLFVSIVVVTVEDLRSA